MNVIDERNRMVRTALHAAAAANAHQEATELLERGADVNAKDENGVTALHVAVMADAVNKSLAFSWCRCQWKKENGVTALHFAANDEIMSR